MIVLNIIQFEDLKNKVPEKRWEYLDAINDLREDLKMYICSDRIFAGVYRDYLRQFNIEYESLI